MGSLALMLHCGAKEVARTVFRDATGQWSAEMLADEVPLVIVEQLIEEAKLPADAWASSS